MRYYLPRERPSLARVVSEIRSTCVEQGFQQPTRRPVQRQLIAMDARVVMKAREGAKAARQRFAPVTGQNGRWTSRCAHRTGELMTEPPRNPDAVFIGFCRKVSQKRGRP
jgi:hypothetical protein